MNDSKPCCTSIQFYFYSIHHSPECEAILHVTGFIIPNVLACHLSRFSCPLIGGGCSDVSLAENVFGDISVQWARCWYPITKATQTWEVWKKCYFFIFIQITIWWSCCVWSRLAFWSTRSSITLRSFLVLRLLITSNTLSGGRNKRQKKKENEVVVIWTSYLFL